MDDVMKELKVDANQIKYKNYLKNLLAVQPEERPDIKDVVIRLKELCVDYEST